MPERFIRVFHGSTWHDVARCPCCESLNIGIIRSWDDMRVVCENRGCGLYGPHRKRTGKAVDAWNALPRKTMPS